MTVSKLSNVSLEELAALYKTGATMANIASTYGVSHQAISYRLKKHPEWPFPGLRESRDCRTRVAAQASKTRRANRVFAIYGCDEPTAILFNEGAQISAPNGLAKKFLQQRKHAIRRGIPFLISFPQWVNVWEESGVLKSRGRGEGYCMARNGDVGPYAVGNVYICTNAKNVADYFSSPLRASRAAHRSQFAR